MALVCVCIAGSAAQAADNGLLEVRDALFEESKKMNLVLPDSADPVMIISLWDTCVVAVTRINAYFYMLGILESSAEQKWSAESVDYLLIWLNETRRTIMVAMRQLGEPAQLNEAATDAHRGRIAGYLVQLDSQLEREIGRVGLLKESLNITREER